MPDDHSKVVPLLPIPNRTVKRLCADDSADSRVKVGHRQASTAKTPHQSVGRFLQKIEKSLEENAKSVLQCKASLIAASDKKSDESCLGSLKIYSR